MIEAVQYIEKIVSVKIDRPINSLHPKHGFKYEVNYGYVPNTISGDNEELDVYVLGITYPLQEFTGKCIAVIHRTNDNDDKLIVVPENKEFTNAQIEEMILFQEQWFKHVIIRNPNITKTHFGVYGILKENNKMLVIKKSRGPYTGLFDLPGGSQEKNETFEQTLIREIKEETSLDVTKITNKQSKSIIFSDFTKQSNETGTLQHEAVLFDIKAKGKISELGDNNDCAGAFMIDINNLNEQNATPYSLIGAGKNLINVANKNDHIISTHMRNTPLADNRYIMISAVMLFNSENKVVLQKIASHKKWGGLWTYSAAGHVDAGESYRSAAKRELKEELGIDTKIEKELAIIPAYRNNKQIAFHHIFKAISNDKIVPDANEIADIKLVSLDELKNMANNTPEELFPELLELIKSTNLSS